MHNPSLFLPISSTRFFALELQSSCETLFASPPSKPPCVYTPGLILVGGFPLHFPPYAYVCPCVHLFSNTSFSTFCAVYLLFRWSAVFFFLVSVCVCMLYRGKERKRKETSQSPSAIFLVYFGLPATSPIHSLSSFPFSPHTKGRTAFSYCTCVCVLCLSHRIRRGSSSPLSATMHLPTTERAKMCAFYNGEKGFNPL